MTDGGPVEISIDVAKLPKEGDTVSGDTVEVIERPAGGLSVVLAVGEGEGTPAKAISTFVAHRALEEIANGTKDGVAARAAGDALFASREGTASASLVILSADVPANVIVVSRNAPGPVIVKTPEEILVYEEEVPVLGTEGLLKPNIYTVGLLPGTFAATFSEGVVLAGEATGHRWGTQDLMGTLEHALDSGAPSVARAIIDAAIERDGGKPAHDMTVVLLCIGHGREGDLLRTLRARLPV